MIHQRLSAGDSINIRLRILGAVNRSLDVISVQEICNNAGISRQTFYNYFDSKYSIVSWWSEWCEGFYLNKIGYKYSWEEGSLRHTQLLYSNKEFLYHALASKKHLPYLGRDQIAARRKEVLFRTLEDKGIEIDDVLQYCVESYSMALVEGTYQKLRKGGIRSLDLIKETKKSLAIIPPVLYQAIQIPEFLDSSQLENFNKLDQIVQKVMCDGFDFSFNYDREVMPPDC
jgi:hypothetical protein